MILKDRSTLIGMVLSLSAVAPCLALEPANILLFAKGPVVLRPQLDISERYDDNLFYQSTGRESDFITLISPGLNLQLGKPEVKYYLGLEYAFDQFIYAEHRDLDANQHRFSLNNHVKGNYLSLEGQDRIELLSSILGGGGFSSAQGQKVDRTTFSDVYTLRYHMTPNSSVYGRGSYTAVDYQDDVALYDSNELTGTAGFEIKPLSKTSFFGEIYYGQTGTDPNGPLIKPPHSDFVGGFAGARGAFTEHLTGMVKAGYESRSFSDGTPDPSSPVVELSLSQRFTEKNALTLSYVRRSLVSVELATQAFTLDSAVLGFVQKIGAAERWKASLLAAYSVYSYEKFLGATRTDDLFSGTVAISYDIRRWLSTRLSYQFEQYSSDAPSVIDYNVNRVTISLAVGY